MFAPIFRSGRMTRSIGRAESVAPPTSTLSKFCPASRPASKPHGGRGISAINFAGGRGQQSLLAVHDEHVRLGMLDLDAEAAHRLDGAEAIVAGQKAAQHADAVRKRADDDGAMRDALVAGDRDLRLDAGRSFNAKFHTTLFNRFGRSHCAPGKRRRATLSIGTIRRLVQRQTLPLLLPLFFFSTRGKREEAEEVD